MIDIYLKEKSYKSRFFKLTSLYPQQPNYILWDFHRSPKQISITGSHLKRQTRDREPLTNETLTYIKLWNSVNTKINANKCLPILSWTVKTPHIDYNNVRNRRTTQQSSKQMSINTLSYEPMITNTTKKHDIYEDYDQTLKILCARVLEFPYHCPMRSIQHNVTKINAFINSKVHTTHNMT